jgi:hypothetical protein
MPKPRAVTRPPPLTPEERAFKQFRERWRPLRQWKQAVHREAWRLVHAEGGHRCGSEEFDRARQSLIDQGRGPPAGFEDWT